MADNIKEKVEDKILDWIALGTSGRLVAFKSGAGILTVQKKGGYGEKELVFKIESFIVPGPDEKLQRQLAKDSFKPAKNLYVIFLVFDEIKQKLEEKIWMIPSLDMANKKNYNFETSEFPDYVKDRKDFIIFLIESLITENKQKFKSFFKRKAY